MKYDITTLKRKVLALYPYFGSVASGVEYEASESVQSIKNNGKTIYYNPTYMTGLTVNEQLFVLAHELCHVAFRHFERGKGKDAELWKTATDAVVNQLLKRDGMELMLNAIDYPEAIDYDAEEYYEILLQNKLVIELMGGDLDGTSSPGGSGSDGSDSTSDEDHDDNHDEDSDPNEAYDEFQNGTAQEKDDDEEDQGEELFQELAQQQEMNEDMEEPEPSDPSDDEDKKSSDEDDENSEYKLQATVTPSQSGNSENPDVRAVEEIGTAKPLIDWRLLLRDTINYGVDWSYTNAILEDGIIRPILEEIPMPETEIVLDTSWSVDEDLLQNFLRECKNILQLSKLKVGCFDTVFMRSERKKTLKRCLLKAVAERILMLLSKHLRFVSIIGSFLPTEKPHCRICH